MKWSDIQSEDAEIIFNEFNLESSETHDDRVRDQSFVFFTFFVVYFGQGETPSGSLDMAQNISLRVLDSTRKSYS
jgi:hypothetical protein